MTVTQRFIQFFTLSLILFAFATPAFAQSWSSANGKFTIEAEFVQQKDGKVQLKKESNGDLIWVELEKLSEDDRKRAQRLQKAADKKAVKASKPENGMLDQIELKCSAELKESEFHGEDPQIVVSVSASGPPAVQAMSYGKIKLAKFMDGKGKKLTPEKDRLSFEDISKSLKKIERGRMFATQPDDGIVVELRLPADVSPEMISEVSGSFSILTGGERSVESWPKLTEHFGKTIKSEVLKKAKLKVEVEKPSADDHGYSMSFNVSGNLSALNRIDGAVELKIPFEFSDLEVTGQ